MRQTGENLKQAILDCARTMFHDLGYEETTFQKIADELHITKGAITYHFKNKHFLMIMIFDECFSAIRAYIDQFPECYRNRYWYEITTYLLLYCILFQNPHSRQLFFLRGNQEMWEVFKVKTIFNIYRNIADDFHKEISAEELSVAAEIDVAARRRLYRMYKEGNSLVSNPKQFCFYHLQLIGQLCHLDSMDIVKNIEAAFSFVEQHPLPQIPFLIDSPSN